MGSGKFGMLMSSLMPTLSRGRSGSFRRAMSGAKIR